MRFLAEFLPNRGNDPVGSAPSPFFRPMPDMDDDQGNSDDEELTPLPTDFELTPEPVQPPLPQRAQRQPRPEYVSRSGRVSRPPLAFAEEFGYACKLQEEEDVLARLLDNVHEVRSFHIPEYIKDIHDGITLAMAGAENILKDPATLSQAVNDSQYGEDWKTAIELELQAFFDMNAWQFELLPEDRKPVKPKWVFHYKMEDHKVKRCKARLVAKGFTQRHGIDYSETFAAVAKMDSIRLLFSIAVQNDLHIHHMDVKNAFLTADLDHEIYLAIPEAMQVPDYVLERLQAQNSDRPIVLRLLKSMYGLKQAS